MSQVIRLQTPSQVSRLQTPETTRIWKVMHHPEWLSHTGSVSAHPEEDELIRSGEYWTFPRPHFTNADTEQLRSMNVGDVFVMQPKRTTRKGSGLPLKTPAPQNYLRKGTITQQPKIAPQSFDTRKDWYVIKIEWDERMYPLNPEYRNKPHQSITEQH